MILHGKWNYLFVPTEFTYINMGELSGYHLQTCYLITNIEFYDPSSNSMSYHRAFDDNVTNI